MWCWGRCSTEQRGTHGFLAINDAQTNFAEGPPRLRTAPKVRGLVHFSAHTRCDGLYVLAENMDLTPSRHLKS